MQRLIISALLLSATLSAQDHILLGGFGDSGGPSGPKKRSYPVARIKDNDRDGQINVSGEIHAFVKTSFSQQSNGSFMTDISTTIEDGRVAFYFTDSGDGRVVRGVDKNHNGLLDNNELTMFHHFSCRFSPDSLAVWRDQTKKQTIVYVALDENPRGIHRLVDLNNDGDASDPGEASLFVHAGLNLSVPGKSGPVKLTSDTWKRLRFTPKGTLLAYNGGRYPASVAQNPDMYALYAIKDNQGKATVSVWLNTSRINGLKTHPDFDANGKFPQYDLKTTSASNHPLWNDVSFLEVDPRGAFPGFDAYYFSATYSAGTTGRGDKNPAGTKISGLIYRVVDKNFNEIVDAGEIELFANISNATVAGVKPFTYINRVDSKPTLNLDNDSGVEVHDLGASNGQAHLYWENGGNDCVVTMTDTNRNGIIETGEAVQPWFTPGGSGSFPPPFSPQYGPYSLGGESLEGILLPGPFPGGVLPLGDGCASSNGLRPLTDTFNGSPRLSNSKFTIGLIRGAPTEQAALFLGMAKANTNLSFLNMPGCFLLTSPIITIPGIPTNAKGQAQLGIPIPNNSFLLGAKIYIQWAFSDRRATGRLPFFTTNAVEITVLK